LLDEGVINEQEYHKLKTELIEEQESDREQERMIGKKKSRTQKNLIVHIVVLATFKSVKIARLIGDRL